LTGLPAGKYVVTAKVQLDLDQDLSSRKVECRLDVADAPEVSTVLLSSPGIATVPFLTPADLPAGGMAILRCYADPQLDGSFVLASNVKMTAIQVDSLILEP